MPDAVRRLAAVKTHVGNARSIFTKPKRLALPTVSPFAHLIGGVTATADQRYMAPEVMKIVIDH